jgi:hypothetical protein
MLISWLDFMIKKIPVLAVVLFSSIVCVHAQPYEGTGSYRVDSFLPVGMVKSDYHLVESMAENNGYLNHYIIKSKYGDSQAWGRSMLQVRLSELRALSELEQYSTSTVFIDSVTKSGKAALLQPVKVVQKLGDLVQNPSKIGDTVSAIPDGVSNLFSWASKQVGAGIDKASEAMSSSDDTKSAEKESSADDSSLSAEAADKAIKIGLDQVDFNDKAGEWYKRLDVDPYTDNESLRDKVDWVAGVESAVGVGFMFVPGVNLGVIGQASSWYDRAEKLGAYEPPSILLSKNEERLQLMKVNELVGKRFLANRHMRESWKAEILINLSGISGATDVDNFLKVAEAIKSPAGGMYLLNASRMVNQYHSNKNKIVRFVGAMMIPAGLTADGHLVVPISVDRLHWTREVAGVFTNFKQRVTHEAPVKSGEVLLFGDLTPWAKTNLEKLGATVTIVKP